MTQSNKISVGIISCSVPPSCSGQSVVLKRLLIDNEDMDCFIFSENLEGEARQLPKYYSLEVAAPDVHKAAADVEAGSKMRFAKSYFRFMWRRADQIIYGIKKNRLDVLVACTGDPLDISATMVASLRTGKPFLVYLFDDATFQWTSPRLRKICGYVESLWTKLAVGAICPNQSLADEYLNRRNLKVKIFANPYSERSLPTHLSQLDAIEKTVNSDRKIKIVYTGSVYHAQADAMQNLVKALTDMNGRAEFHIYSPQPPESKQGYGIDSPLVIWHGFVSEEEALKVQSEGDILFLPLAFHSTIQETLMTALPGKTGEYLSSGTPILVHSPQGSVLSTMFQNNKAAEVVDKPESGMLKSAIEKIISNKLYRDALVKNAQRESKKFDPVILKKEFTQYLRSKV